ncbi:MAG: polysaccharide biosynthesis/export family protein [Candidatus Solibacter sp.]
MTLATAAAYAQVAPVPGPGGQAAALPPDVKQQLEQTAATASAVRAGPYVVRTGDEIEIRSFLIPELNQVAKIRPDGKFSLVLLNDIDATGKTAEELTKLLNELYAQHFRDPRVTVIVKSFFNQSVYVGGEVNQPGVVAIAGGLSATAAIFQAGGFKEAEGPKTVVILHQGTPGPPMPVTVDLAGVLSGAQPDVPLQPSDVLFVPKSTMQIFVGGEVVEPGLVPLYRNMTALTAVIRAKGLKTTANARQALLIRDVGGKPVVQRIDLKLVMAKGIGDQQLQPFDVLVIPKSKIAKVDQAVDQYVRQLIPVGLNMGFSYLFGGTTIF